MEKVQKQGRDEKRSTTTLRWKDGEKEKQEDYHTPAKETQQMQVVFLPFLFTIVPAFLHLSLVSVLFQVHPYLK